MLTGFCLATSRENLPCGEWHESQKAGAFDRLGERSLVQRTGTRSALAHDLSLRGQEFPDHFCIFEINRFDVCCAKIALFFYWCRHN